MRWWRNIGKKTKCFINLALLLLASLPIIYPYFKPNAINTYDTMYRLTRAAKYYVAVKQGQIPPRWIGDTYHGVGEPIFVYLYPFPYQLTTILHIFDISFVNAVKIPLIISFIGSAFTMFYFLREFYHPLPAFVGVLLYLWAPYRMVQLYVRGAYEETMTYLFLPLLFLASWWIYQGKNRRWIFGGVVLGLLLLTQSAISLMFLPSLATYILLLMNRKNFLTLFRNYLLMGLLGFSLAATVILPNIFERHYIQLDKKIAPIYQKNFIPLSRLWDSPWTMIPTPHMLGKAHVLLLIMAVVFLGYALVKKKREMKKNICWKVFLVALFWSLTSLLLSVDSPFARFFWQHIFTIRVIYVPYLFLQLAIFWLAVLAAFLLHHLGRFGFWLATILAVITVVTNISYIKPDYYFSVSDYDLTGFNGPLSQFEEFLPKTAAKAGEQFLTGPFVRTKNKSTKVKVLEKKYQRIKLQIDTETKDELILHQLYFPGWKAFIDGKETTIDYSRPPINFQTGKPVEDAGLITVSVPAGSHQLLFLFTNTPIRLLGDFISGLAFIYVFLILRSANSKRYKKAN